MAAVRQLGAHLRVVATRGAAGTSQASENAVSEITIQLCPECDRPLDGIGTRVIDGDTICYVCAECHDHEARIASLEAANAVLLAAKALAASLLSLIHI